MDPVIVALVALVFGALQALALFILNRMYDELKGIRERLHKLENWQAAQMTLQQIKELQKQGAFGRGAKP